MAEQEVLSNGTNRPGSFRHGSHARELEPLLLEETIGANSSAPSRRIPPHLVESRAGAVDLGETDRDVDAGRVGARRDRKRAGRWPNCAEWTITHYATAKIGAVLVNINLRTAPTSSATR